jgi:hypothetical protein
MAGFLFLVAAIGGVVVADLVLENPTAGQATVFTQPVSGHSQGALLALAAALGFVTALLLVASLAWTRRRTRRRQPHAISANGHGQAAAPQGEQPGLLEEWFGRHVTVAELGQPAPPTDREGWQDQPQDRPVTALPEPSQHQPGSFHQRTRRAAHLPNHLDGWFPPNNQPPR